MLRKATPILLGASCLAALALFHSGVGSVNASPHGSQQLNVPGPQAGHVGAVRINGFHPSDVNGVIMDGSRDAPHIFGAERDAHGCRPSSGHVWCASRGECLQPWVTRCADPSASVQEIAQEITAWDSNSPEVTRLGGRMDEHCCRTSAGFAWCASAGECQQPWAQPCASLDQQLQQMLPEPGQDTADWVLLGHGGCRTASGTEGTYSELPGRVHSIRGSETCRAACAASSSCVAYEIRASDGRCRLHTEVVASVRPEAGIRASVEVIASVHPVAGNDCWAKGQ